MQGTVRPNKHLYGSLQHNCVLFKSYVFRSKLTIWPDDGELRPEHVAIE
jgi:hypothetical protein